MPDVDQTVKKNCYYLCCIVTINGRDEGRGKYYQYWQRILNVSALGYFWMGFLDQGESFFQAGNLEFYLLFDIAA